eukprot:jgi/Chlat1/921/Chrsp108S01358
MENGKDKENGKDSNGTVLEDLSDLSPAAKEAWNLLQSAMMMFKGMPVGTVAAKDPTADSLNYDQVFMRDFVSSGLAFMMVGMPEIVENFLKHTLCMQSSEHEPIDCFIPENGIMPASFKVTKDKNGEETLEADFGELAIGRVAPVDSGLWWFILLRAYCQTTGKSELADRPEFQQGMNLILKLCVSNKFDMFPSLLTTDGCCMIDRRMGLAGHPLEIQSLYYAALRCARVLLKKDGECEHMRNLVENRTSALSFHIREYYWLDKKALNRIYRFATEEYSNDAENKFNVYADSIPSWLMTWMPDKGGYFIGNLGPGMMDFRFFTLGNLMAIVSALATPEQAQAIMDLIEIKWDDLVGDMPMKLVYPAIEGEEWRIVTGNDPKNTPWSYHNGGNWPVLIWLLAAACAKTKRMELAERAVAVMEKKIQEDGWPEYYDGVTGRYIGKQSRLFQTWSISGLLVARMLIKKPELVCMLEFEEDDDLVFACPSALKRQRTK